MKSSTLNGSKGRKTDKNASKAEVRTNCSSKVKKERNVQSAISFDTGEINDTEESPVAAKPGYDLKTPKILKDKNKSTFKCSIASKED